jgi:hypothetical protein
MTEETAEIPTEHLLNKSITVNTTASRWVKILTFSSGLAVATREYEVN